MLRAVHLLLFETKVLSAKKLNSNIVTYGSGIVNFSPTDELVDVLPQQLC